jgi:long-chain acyl-CoA synthetase
MSQLQKYTIPTMLRNSFGQYGPRPSLVFAGEENCTYAQLEKEINRVISQLISFGISKGDKVAILSTNMPNWGIAYFAIASTGAVVVPILPDFSVIEIKNIIDHSEPKVIFVSENLLSKIESITTDPTRVIIRIETFEKISGFDALEVKDAEIETPDMVEEDDLASIIYTSGTTGKSKGVMLTHKISCGMPSKAD